MARSFASASSQYLEGTSIPFSSYPLTFSSCFKAVSATRVDGLLTSAASSLEYKYMGTLTVGSVAGDPVRWQSRFSSGTSTSVVPSTTGYSAGTWHNVVGVTADSTDHAVYLDGGSKGTSTTEVDFPTLDRLSIGRLGKNTPVWYADADIAECAIWEAALTDSEAAMLGAGYSPLMVRPQSLVAYWPLGGIYGEHDNDIVGGFNLTAYNTPTWADHPPIIYPSSPTVLRAAAAAAAAAATLTGTVTSSITKSDIVTGAKTIILTTSGETWVA